MGKSQTIRILFLLLILAMPVVADAQHQRPSSRQGVIDKEKQQPLTRILFVFDASLSMYARWQSDLRINIARQLLTEVMDSLEGTPNIELALRVYGHQKNFPPQDCNDSRLEVPFGPNNFGKIRTRLRTIVPRGTTPIAASLEMAANDFPPCQNCRNIIVLITDGIEECGGDPCAVSQALQKKGIILKPFVIGIGRDFRDDFECVGQYFDASSEKDFRTSLNIVISQALNSTTAQINLLDINGKPNETNVPVTLYDDFSGQVKYNFIHTLSPRGLPDTLILDPLLTYNMVVHTIPEVRKEGIKLVPGIHNIIAVDAPQGSLVFKVAGSGLKNLQAIVRLDGKFNTLNTQYFDQAEKYIVGKYDIEVLSLPRLMIEDVEVSQSHTTTIEIPQPGIGVFRLPGYGYGAIYVEETNELKSIYKLRENVNSETLYLQPGNYQVIWRGRTAPHSAYTIVQKFKIQSGVTTNVNL